MPDDRNPELVAALAAVVAARVRRQRARRVADGASPCPPDRCAECDDVAGDGIDCPACQAIRAARHGRTSEEQRLFNKARQTRSLDDRCAADWRRPGPAPATGPADDDDDDDEPGAGSIETDASAGQAEEGGVTPTPALHPPSPGEPAGGTRKGAVPMAARLPRGEMPPLRSGEPPRREVGRCENPHANPRCLGTSTGRLCRSCGILEARRARGLPPGRARRAALSPSPATPGAPPGTESGAIQVALDRGDAAVAVSYLDDLASRGMAEIARAEKTEDPEFDLQRCRDFYRIGRLAGQIRLALERAT